MAWMIAAIPMDSRCASVRVDQAALTSNRVWDSTTRRLLVLPLISMPPASIKNGGRQAEADDLRQRGDIRQGLDLILVGRDRHLAHARRDHHVDRHGIVRTAIFPPANGNH